MKEITLKTNWKLWKTKTEL